MVGLVCSVLFLCVFCPLGFVFLSHFFQNAKSLVCLSVFHVTSRLSFDFSVPRFPYL